MIQQLQISGMVCQLYLPPEYDTKDTRYPTIYINGEVSVSGILTKLVNINAPADFILLSIQPKSWNDDFTPWEAPAFRKGEEAPKGKADAYLSCLTKEIKPFMDAHYRTKPEAEHTALFGYSLGGLAALYAAYRTDLFGAAASLSGSLWYDGFCAFMEREKPLRTDLRVYLSLGKKESKSKNPRMAKVAECTEHACKILEGQLKESGGEKGFRSGRECTEQVYFEWNEGGHFHEVEERFVKAILWWQQFL